MEHTKGKWYVGHNDNDIWCKDIGTVRAFVLCECMGRETNEANAQRIVKCVNAHDGLVEALKEAQRYILTTKTNKKFDIKKTDDFHIAAVMSEALASE